jgi:hypothetical protein
MKVAMSFFLSTMARAELLPNATYALKRQHHPERNLDIGVGAAATLASLEAGQ